MYQLEITLSKYSLTKHEQNYFNDSITLTISYKTLELKHITC